MNIEQFLSLKVLLFILTFSFREVENDTNIKYMNKVRNIDIFSSNYFNHRYILYLKDKGRYEKMWGNRSRDRKNIRVTEKNTKEWQRRKQKSDREENGRETEKQSGERQRRDRKRDWQKEKEKQRERKWTL